MARATSGAACWRQVEEVGLTGHVDLGLRPVFLGVREGPVGTAVWASVPSPSPAPPPWDSPPLLHGFLLKVGVLQLRPDEGHGVAHGLRLEPPLQRLAVGAARDPQRSVMQSTQWWGCWKIQTSTRDSSQPRPRAARAAPPSHIAGGGAPGRLPKRTPVRPSGLPSGWPEDASRAR